MPEGQPQWGQYALPELDVKEYNEKLKALLWRRFYEGALDVAGKRLKANREDDIKKAENYINFLVRQTVSEGVNPRLPFYNEIIRATMTPEWYQEQVGQYQQEMGTWWAQTQEAQLAQQWKQYGAGEAEKWRQFGAEFDVARWQQQEAWRRYGEEKERTQLQWELEQARQAAELTQKAYRDVLRFQTQRGREGRGEREKAQMFESMRAELLAGLGGPRNWIQRYMVETRPNPYEERGQKWEAPPTTPETPKWLGTMYPELGERMPERERPAMGRAKPMGTVGGFEMAPPSGQAWGRLTPSQQAGWGGMARFYGASPEDLLFQTQQMLPRDPWRTPQRRWAPAKQRVSV